MLDFRKLLEATVGYGDWGDEDFVASHPFRGDLLETLKYKAELLLNNTNGHNDEWDVANFLNEFVRQIKNYHTKNNKNK